VKGQLVRDLVIRAQGGDREAFAALVALTSDRSFALAARILRDHDLAEDALQGALIAAWRQLPTLRDPDRFEAWVRKVLVHACYAEARRRRSWAANVRVLPVDGPAGPDDLISVDDRDALERAFRRLSVQQRAVFVLHHHQGLSLVEIAENLGIPAGTARSRLHHATRVLRGAIEADARTVAPEGRMA
jgi:RNA polymerase sigma-70 factor (ECF subfamily)